MNYDNNFYFTFFYFIGFSFSSKNTYQRHGKLFRKTSQEGVAVGNEISEARGEYNNSPSPSPPPAPPCHGKLQSRGSQKGKGGRLKLTRNLRSMRRITSHFPLRTLSLLSLLLLIRKTSPCHSPTTYLLPLLLIWTSSACNPTTTSNLLPPLLLMGTRAPCNPPTTSNLVLLLFIKPQVRTPKQLQ